ncbi:MAG: 3-deoxy-manno-octulosonate cytidylyltransferase [Proteobacteria bacterium]|nr:3-deoxy-manno-octulosonate cytidylyltransferase [Pseudomonadota bacterium]
MKKVIVIPARYASTRLPGKALREISGKPIIQWVYERALKSALKDSIFIATDDERIKDAAVSFDADVIMTSPECKSGTDRIYQAIKDREADIIINLQGDEPFIRADIIDSLFYAMEKENLTMATLCSPIDNEADYMNPNVVKVVLDRFGFALYFSRSPVPFFRNAMSSSRIEIKDPQFRARNSGCIYKHIGIYGFSRYFLKQYVEMEESILEAAESLEQLRVLENGYDIKVLITNYDGAGIDTEEDLEQARRMSHFLAV